MTVFIKLGPRQTNTLCPQVIKIVARKHVLRTFFSTRLTFHGMHTGHQSGIEPVTEVECFLSQLNCKSHYVSRVQPLTQNITATTQQS